MTSSRNETGINEFKLIWNFNNYVAVFGSIQCSNVCDCVRFYFVGLHTLEKLAGIYLSLHVLNHM